MADWGKGDSSFNKMASNPAAPAGMQQAGERYSYSIDQFQQGKTSQQPWVPQDVGQMAKNWYTGQNTLGIDNGWNTPFYQKFFAQDEEYRRRAAEAGTDSVYYQQFQDPEKKETGIALWDDPKGQFRVGDVFVDGELQAGQNLYDSLGEEQASWLLGSLYISGSENKELFRRRDQAGYAEDVRKVAKEWSDVARFAPQAEDYQARVEENAEGIREGFGDNLLKGLSTLGGMAGGFGTGFTAGAALGSWTGPGSLITGLAGGVIGTVVGGVAGWDAANTNQDQLTDMAARVVTRQQMVEERFSGVQEVLGWGHTLEEASALGMKFISPAQNFVHGMQERQAGTVGDGEVDWYARDESGNAKAGLSWKALDIAAAVADGVGQFGSPVGKVLYTGTMGAGVTGRVMGDVLTDQSFDEATGTWHEYGNWNERASAYGSIGIDALQTAVPGLMSRAARNARSAAGMDEVSFLGRKGTPAQRPGRLDDEVVGATRFEKALNPKTHAVEATGSKWTVESLVPSELARKVSVGLRARQLARRDEKTLTPDHLYRAALELSGGSQWRTAAVNAYGEGVEEFTQTYLDEWSFGRNADFRSAMEAAAYGAAGGLGMGLGQLNRRPSPEALKDRQRRQTHESRTGTTFTDEAWAAEKELMSPRALEMLDVRTPEEDAEFGRQREATVELLRRGRMDSPVAQAGVRVVGERARDDEMRRANELGGDALELMGQQTEFTWIPGTHGDDPQINALRHGPNTVTMSFSQVMTSLGKRGRAVEAQLKDQQRLVKKAEKALAAANAALKAGVGKLSDEQVRSLEIARDDATTKVTRHEGYVEDLTQQLRAVRVLLGDKKSSGGLLVGAFDKWSRMRNLDDQKQAIEEFNLLLKNLYELKVDSLTDDEGALDKEALKTVIELLLPRHPTQDMGSFNVTLPQVSLLMSNKNSHRTVGVHQAVLKALGADHDGDKVVQQFDLYVSPEMRKNLRRGLQYLQHKGVLATSMVDEDGKLLVDEAGERQWEVNIDLPASEEAYIDLLSSTLMPERHQEIVTEGFKRLGDRLWERYVSGGPDGKGPKPMDAHQMAFEKAINDFFDAANGGVTDARVRFAQTMWDLNGEGLFEMSDSTHVPEIAQLWVMISTEWENIRLRIGMHKFAQGDPVDPGVEAVQAETKAKLATRARLWASSIGQTIAGFGAGPEPRASQFLHYEPLRQASIAWGVAKRTDTMNRGKTSPEMAVGALYALLGSGQTQTDLDAIDAKGRVKSRVVNWLDGFARDFAATHPTPLSPKRLYLLLASMEVGDFRGNPDVIGEQITMGDGPISLLQLLLRRSIQIEENIHRDREPGSALDKQLEKLRSFTYPKGERSTTSAEAMMEVLGDMDPQELLGDQAHYFGRNMTMRQHMKLLLSMSQHSARREWGKYKTHVPAYLRTADKADPIIPVYTIEQLASQTNDQVSEQDDGTPQINAFTILVDTVQTATSAARAQRKQQAKSTEDGLVAGLVQLQDALQTWYQMHTKAITDLAKADNEPASHRHTFRHMLANYPEIAETIAELVPDASAEFVFQLKDGHATATRFMEDVLIDPNSARAAARFYVFNKWAEWAAMQQTPWDLSVAPVFNDDTGMWESPKAEDINLDDFIGKVHPSQIKSRFLETLYYLATLKGVGRHELLRFMQTTMQSESLSEIFDAINKEPVWMFGRAELLPFNDSVSDYELMPSDIFNTGSPDTLYRERLENFTTTMERHARNLRYARDMERGFRGTTAMMKAQNAFEKKSGKAPKGWRHNQEAALHLHNLDQAIENVRTFGDLVGPRIREQIMEAFDQMLIRIHDKGKADVRIAPLSDARATVDSIGFGSAMVLEFNAITSHSWDSVASSPSMCADGPIRIMLKDGSEFVLDLSTREGALEALSNPVTQQFAVAVIFPIMRDVNNFNVVQPYTDSQFMQDGKPDLGLMLEEAAKNVSLFNVNNDDKYKQSMRLIAFLEGQRARAALDAKSSKDVMDGYFPIMRMINEILEAYHTTEGTGRTPYQREQLRRNLIVQIGDGLKMIGQLDASLLDETQQMLFAIMQKRMGKEHFMDRMFETQVEKDQREATEKAFRNSVEVMLAADKDAAYEVLHAAEEAGDPKAISKAQDVYQEKFWKLMEYARSGSLTVLDGTIASRDWESAERTFHLEHTPGSKSSDTLKKIGIVSFLLEGGRVNKFEDIKESVAIKRLMGDDASSWQALFEKFIDNAYDPNGGVENIEKWDFTPEEWNQFSLWATLTMLGERAGRSSSDTKALWATSKTVAEFQRLHDASWTMLLDELFNPKTHQAMQLLTAQSGNTAGFYESMSIPTTTSEIAERLANTVLSERVLAKWNPSVVVNILKMDLALRQVRSTGELPKGGDYPKIFGPINGVTSGITFTVPDDKYMTAFEYNLPEPVTPALKMFSVEDYVLLHNHFVKEVKFVLPDGTEVDLMPSVTTVDTTNAETKGSGLRILNMLELSRQIDLLRKKHPGVAGMRIIAVDTRKQPFDSLEWANNRFFDGRGRDAVGRTEVSLMASMIFGVGGESKVLQQGPLNVLKSGGELPPSFRNASFRKVQTLEKGTIFQVMKAKAWHIMTRSYPTSEVTFDDLPAIYQYVKLLHVVVGRNTTTGEKEVWWAQDYIQKELAGEAGVLVDMDDPTKGPKLVALERTAANRIYGGSGYDKYDSQRPMLNVQDLPSLPDLSKERLEELGLDRLGETAELDEAPIAQFRPLPASLPFAGPADTVRSYRELDLDAAARRANEIKQRRDDSWRRSAPARGFEPVEKAFNMLRYEPEALHRLLTRMMGNEAAQMLGSTDVQEIRSSARLLAVMAENTDDRSMTWEFRIDLASNDYAKGFISRTGLEEIDGTDANSVAFGDTVVIDLHSILTWNGGAAGDVQKAAEQAREVVDAFSRLGVKLMIGSSAPQTELRRIVAEYLTSGQSHIRYQRVDGTSGHFYEPVFDDKRIDMTRESYDSDLTAIDEDHTKNLNVVFMPTEGGPSLQEGVREVTDRFFQVCRKVVLTLVPTHYTLPMSKDNVFAISLPKQYMTEQGDLYTEFASELVGYARMEVKNPDTGKLERPGEKELLRRLGVPKQGIPVFTRYPNGTYSPGIRNPKDALRIFIDTLAAGRVPMEVGSEMMTGDLYLGVTNRGEFIINRVGYELPREGDKVNITAQWNEPLGGVGGLKIAVGPNKPDPALTHLPPFTVTEVTESEKDGFKIKGEHALDWFEKIVTHGLKTQMTGMPVGLSFAGPLSDNGTAVGSRVSPVDTAGKSAGRGRVSTFRNMWALAGMDNLDDLVRIIMPEGDGSLSYAQRADRVMTLLRVWARSNNHLTGERAMQLLSDPRLVYEELTQINQRGVAEYGSTWFDIENTALKHKPDETSPTFSDDTRLLHIYLVTLCIAGMTPEQLISSPGLLSTEDPFTTDAVVGYLPEAFTTAFQSLDYPNLRQKMIDRVNDGIPTFVDLQKAEERKVGWFDHALIFHHVMRQELPDGSFFYYEDEGRLQLETPLPADENAINLAFNIPGNRDGSLHLARTASGQGFYTTLKTSKQDKEGNVIPELADRFYGGMEYESFDDAALFYDFLTRVAPPTSEHYYPAKYLMPLEHAAWLDSDDKMGGYLIGADRANQEWPDNGRAKDILKILNLPLTDLREIDYLVRQFVGAPAPKRDTDEIDSLTHASYVQAVEQILSNVEKGYHPLHGGDVPIEHHSFWYKVFMANKATGRNKPWAPVSHIDTKNRKRLASDDWSEWVLVLMSQVRESHREIHGMFASEIAGFFHTYQNTDPTFVEQPLTMSNLVNAKLADPDTNELFISPDPGAAALAHDPPLLETMQATWRTISGHADPTFKAWAATDTPASTVVKRAAIRAKWLDQFDRQKRATMHDYWKDGLEFKESLNANHIFLHSFAHISIVNRLINFGLWVGAPIEVGFRNMLDRTTDALLGKNAGFSNRLFGWVAGLAGEEGPKPRFNAEQQRQLRKAAKMVGGDPKWRGQLMGETNYQANLVKPQGELDENGQPIEHKGRKWAWGAFWEKSAGRVATIVNDPTFGMRKSAAGLRYLQAAIEYLDMTGNHIDIDTLLQELERDSLWLMHQFPRGEISPHSFGAAAVGQVRATRGTVLGNTIMRPVDRLFNSQGTAKVMAGLLLKIPLMFTRFQANAFLTLTGLGSLDSMAAAALHDRQTAGSYIKSRYRAWKNLDEAPPEYYDYKDVLETFDMERIVLRGAVSQTGFALAGMFGAQVLGLGGEDEEERKRRLRDKYLGIPPMYDPREAENGFEYADAIWLEEVPILGTMLKPFLGRDLGGEERMPVVPHWILRQFTSPLMGIVRAFSTGDFSNVRYGFLDAASVLPHSLLGLWREADYTAGLLLNDVQELQQLGVETNEMTSRAAWMLMNFVGIYEKAMFENQMFNTWMIAMDPVDRNPFKIPETTETGEIVREEGTGYPLPTTALEATQTDPFLDPVSGEPMVDENGDPVLVENKLTYAKRTGMDGLLHQYAESNMTAALALSLMPGKGFFMRHEMVPKKELIPVALGEEEELKALVFAAFYGEGGQDSFTKDEIAYALKYKYQQANIRWNQPSIDKQTEELYREWNDAPLTIWGPDTQEIITNDGTKGVFRSLLAGKITFDSPALQGAHFPVEMRQEVARELLDEIVQESIDWGMSPQSAEYRKRRLWFGDQSTGQIGLRELVFSNQLPYKSYTEYTQLNVTYAVGPDGKMWATPFTRANMLGALGIPVPHSMKKLPEGLGYDTRGNVVNYITQTNTGGKAIVPGVINTQLEPDDSVLAESKDPKKTTTGTWRSSGYRGYSRRGYGGYSRRGGGYGGSDYASPMFTDKILRAIRAGYGPQMDGTYAPNFDNPIVRRADVRRERVSSERGRLKQWQ